MCRVAICLAAGLLLLGTPEAYSQEVRASITGLVTDPTAPRGPDGSVCPPVWPVSRTGYVVTRLTRWVAAHAPRAAGLLLFPSFGTSTSAGSGSDARLDQGRAVVPWHLPE